MRKVIVIGVGAVNGLGAQLSIRFASKNHHVIIAGRTEQKLQKVAAEIQKVGGMSTPIVADATNEQSVLELFAATRDIPGELTLAIYNAGTNMPGRIVEMEASYFEHCWRSCCFGAFLFARGAIQEMESTGGTLLFTGASAAMRGRENFGAFNAAKGAQRLLAQAMAKEYGPDGIHVGHVIVDGAIAGDRFITRLPEVAEQLGEDGMIKIGGIVDAYEFLYQQPRNSWSFEIDVRTSVENW